LGIYPSGSFGFFLVLRAALTRLPCYHFGYSASPRRKVGGARCPPEDGEELHGLCKRIMEEQDPQIFDDLVKALNDLLDRKHTRIHFEHQKDYR
jgi:hypothetical protein